METATTFYDEGRYPTSNNGNNSGSNMVKDEVRKRLTLDLNSPRLKKPRFDVLLSSPDLNMLKLPSPELEKLIMQQNGLLSATPTPSGFIYPPPTSNNGNPRVVTRDQEMYGQGFDIALAELHSKAAAAQQAPPPLQQQQQHCIESGNAHHQPFTRSSASPFQPTLQVYLHKKAVYIPGTEAIMLCQWLNSKKCINT